MSSFKAAMRANGCSFTDGRREREKESNATILG
jgi:hypothetical protein